MREYKVQTTRDLWNVYACVNTQSGPSNYRYRCLPSWEKSEREGRVKINKRTAEAYQISWMTDALSERTNGDCSRARPYRVATSSFVRGGWAATNRFPRRRPVPAAIVRGRRRRFFDESSRVFFVNFSRRPSPDI